MAKKTNVSPNGRPEPTPSKSFENLVARVNKTTDIKKLKKTIYNRNYNIRQKKLREDPELAAREAVVKFPPIYDVRLITASAFKRISKIKDKEQQLKELRQIIIDTTRRRATPKTIADYSNREQDYLENGVLSLQAALSNWVATGADGVLKGQLETAFSKVTMQDIEQVFSKIPSYWAISSGHYYAAADFDKFVFEIINLIQLKDQSIPKDHFYKVKRDGSIQYTKNYESFANMLFQNDPRQNTPK